MNAILNALMTLIVLVSSITSSASDAAILATATATQALESVKSDTSAVVVYDETITAEDTVLLPAIEIIPTVDPADDTEDDTQKPEEIEIDENDVPLAGWPIDDEAADETETADDTAGNETEMPSDEITAPTVPDLGPALPPPAVEQEYPEYPTFELPKIDPPLPCCTTVQFNGDGTVTLTNTHDGGFLQTTCSEDDYWAGNFRW